MDLPERKKQSRLDRRKLNPLYLFAVFVIALPFGLVWMRGTMEEERSSLQVEREWISLMLPAPVLEDRSSAQGIHYLTAGNSGCEVVVALVPASADSSIYKALTAGTVSAGQSYIRLFSSIKMTKLVCQSLGRLNFALTGKRRGDNWSVAGRLQFSPTSRYVLAVVAIASEESYATDILSEVTRSAKIKVVLPAPTR